MPTAIENAQLVESLFRPLTETIAGANGRDVKAEQINANERLRLLKQQQDDEDKRRDFEYRKALVQLQTDSQERITDKQTERIIAGQNEATNRAIAIQDSIAARAEAKSLRDDLTKAQAQYRILAGGKAKPLTEFGDTPEKQLQGLNTELALLNDNRSRAVAKIALQAQREYSDELDRITKITPADEPTLVGMAMGSITDKDTMEKLRKMKPKNSADVTAALTILNPQAASEFAGAYESAKDSVINNRAKNSKIPALEKNLQAHTILLQKDPKAAEYVALGLQDDTTPNQTPVVPKQQTLDDIFKTKPPAPVVAPAPAPQAALTPDYGGAIGAYNYLKQKAIPNTVDSLGLFTNTAALPFARGLNYLAGGSQRVDEGDAQRQAVIDEILKRYQQRNTPGFIPAQ